MSTQDRIIFLLDMDAFFASVEERENPELKGKPVMVVGSPSERSVVCAANYEIRKYGVHSAMAYTKAIRLCPHAQVVNANPVLYRDTSRSVFDICESFTDLLEISSIDECYMDMTPTAERFGGALEAGRLLKQKIFEEELVTCTIGIGPNKLIAKLAAGLNKPDGLSQVKPDDVPKLLTYLPVQKLHGLGPKTAAALKSIGVTTAGSLGAFDVSILRRMFGVYGDRLSEMGRGIDHSPVVPYYESPLPKSVSHEHTLGEDTRDVESLRRIMRSLSEHVARRLRKHELSARTVGLTIRFSNLQRITRSATLTEASDDGLSIYHSVLPLLDNVLKDRRSIRLIGVFTGNLAQGAIQQGLFEDGRKRRLTDAVDALNDKLGKTAVKPASLVDTHHHDHITFRG